MKKTDGERIYEAGMSYLDLKLSIIPIGFNKRPLIPWEDYQGRLCDYSEWKGWDERFCSKNDHGMNVGIVTGKVSGIFVMDLDSEEAKHYVKDRGVPDTPCAITGKGVHIYMSYPRDIEVRNRSYQDLGIDIRGDGGYVVAPPSKHPSGHYYTWTEKHPWNTDFAPPLDWMYELIDDRGSNGLRERGWQNELLKGVTEGGRNHACASLAGRLLTKGLTASEVLEIILMWNETRNNPPLPEWEVERTVESIVARDKRRNQ